MTSSPNSPETKQTEPRRPVRGLAWFGWLPILVLPAAALACRNYVVPWVLMWALSVAIFGGLKWLTWWRAAARVAAPEWRSVAFLVAWPGMDADAFLDAKRSVAAPRISSWMWAAFETALGAFVMWVAARAVPAEHPLARGWVGMLGLILLLHFGSFQLIALFWRARGVDAVPIMDAPARSTSLAEFWGKRWNLGFHHLAYELIYRPARRALGAQPAILLVFVASGLIHDLVISVPARGGYGLPTAYFLLQGLGIQIERTQIGKRLGLREGVLGWIFTAVFVTAPVYWLFHPWFVMRVILPFMQAIHAL